jgi:hypothetical protein
VGEYIWSQRRYAKKKEEERWLFLFSISSVAIYAAACGCVRDWSDARHFLEPLPVVQPTRVFL